MKKKCQAIVTSGRRCRFPAMFKQDYCWIHIDVMKKRAYEKMKRENGKEMPSL